MCEYGCEDGLALSVPGHQVSPTAPLEATEHQSTVVYSWSCRTVACGCRLAEDVCRWGETTVQPPAEPELTPSAAEPRRKNWTLFDPQGGRTDAYFARGVSICRHGPARRLSVPCEMLHAKLEVTPCMYGSIYGILGRRPARAEEKFDPC